MTKEIITVSLETEVEHAMTPNTITFLSDASIETVAALMAGKNTTPFQLLMRGNWLELLEKNLF